MCRDAKDADPERATAFTIKQNCAVNGFVHIVAELIHSLYEIDKVDKLLCGIRKLRKEDLTIMEENDIQVNSERKFVYSEKFSLIFQDQICKFIENQNYLDIVAILEAKYPDSQDAACYFCHEFAGASASLKNFDRYVARHFSGSEEKHDENPLLAYPFQLFFGNGFKTTELRDY